MPTIYTAVDQTADEQPSEERIREVSYSVIRSLMTAPDDKHNESLNIPCRILTTVFVSMHISRLIQQTEISVSSNRIARRGRATDGKAFGLAEEGPSSNGQDGLRNSAGRESWQGPRNDTDPVNRMIRQAVTFPGIR